MEIFVDQALAARLELASAWRGVHYVRARAALRPEAGCAAEELAGGLALYGGAGSPVSRACGLGMAGPVAGHELDAVEAFFRERGAAPAVDLCPLADPSLLALLQARGYRPRGWLSVLAARLPLPLAGPEGVSVERCGPDDAELWLRTAGQGFDEAEQPAAETLEVLAPNFYSAAAACYLARVGGEPAGAGGAYAHAGVVELGGASTRPAFRRRGVQRALLARRLDEAHAAGCDLSLVLASPGGASQRNVERCGFRLAYTRLTLELV